VAVRDFRGGHLESLSAVLVYGENTLVILSAFSDFFVAL
jgi:hypothetical protein